MPARTEHCKRNLLCTSQDICTFQEINSTSVWGSARPRPPRAGTGQTVARRRDCGDDGAKLVVRPLAAAPPCQRRQEKMREGEDAGGGGDDGTKYVVYLMVASPSH